MFKYLIIAATCLFTLSFLTLPANASVITFDDYYVSGIGYRAIQDGYYEALNWDNFYVNETDRYTSPNGYINGAVSPSKVAFNINADPATISSASLFNLNSGYFTGAWRDGLNISVTAYLDDIQKYSETFIVNSTTPSFILFNWSNINSVVFESFGGVDNPNYDYAGPQFVMDNLDISSVPVPAALPLFGLGLASLSIRAKRKRKENA